MKNANPKNDRVSHDTEHGVCVESRIDQKRVQSVHLPVVNCDGRERLTVHTDSRGQVKG